MKRTSLIIFSLTLSLLAVGVAVGVVSAGTQTLTQPCTPAPLIPAGNDLRTRVTDWNGKEKVFESDFETATVWKETDPTPFGYTVTRDYSSYRRIICEKDKRGNSTRFDWFDRTAFPNEFVKFYLSDTTQNVLSEGIPQSINTHYEYNFTTNHEVREIRDPRGKITEYQYNDPANPHAPTHILEPPDEDGGPQPTTVLAYDNRGRVLTRQDPNGNVTTYGYDGYNWGIPDQTGLVTSIVRPGITGVEKFAYTTMGLLKRHKEPAHSDVVYTDYTYDRADRLTTTLFPGPGGTPPDHGPSTIVRTYDDNGNLETVTDQLNKLTTYQYDVLNRPKKTIRHDQSFSEILEYDDNGNVLRVRDFNGVETEHDYDELNRVKEERRAVNRGNDTKLVKTRFVYDENGNLRQRKEVALNDYEVITTYDYDELNRVFAVHDPPPFQTQVEQYVYDENGNRIKTIDRRNNLTESRYTNRNLLKAVKRPGWIAGDPDEAYRTDYEYDATGNRRFVRVWRKDNNVWVRYSTEYQYDSTNRTRDVTDPLGRITHTDYDDNSNVTDVRMPIGTPKLPKTTVTHTTYDRLNRAKTVTEDFNDEPGNTNLNLTTTTTYDEVGNRRFVQDPELVTTNYRYNDLHGLEHVFTPVGRIATYEYDDNGNRTEVTDGLNHTTQFVYDGLNRLKKTIDPLQKAVETFYDEFGDPERRVDGNTAATTYIYDNLHRLKDTLYPAHGADPAYTETRGYDANSNLTRLTDTLPVQRTNLENEYDALNRLTAAIDHLLFRRIEYDYDTYDNRTAMRVKDHDILEETVTYAYDPAGQLIAESKVPAAQARSGKQGPSAFTYSYYDDGARKELVKPTGAKTTYAYDAARRLEELQNLKADQSALSAFRYDYDNVGNRTQMDVTLDGKPSHSVAYGYDDLYRLTDELRTGENPVTNVWGYDLAGNRRFHLQDGDLFDYQYNAANELLQYDVPAQVIFSDNFSAPPLDDWIVRSGSWSEPGGVLRSDTESGRPLLEKADYQGSAYSAAVDLHQLEPLARWKGIAFHIQNPQNYLLAEIVQNPLEEFPEGQSRGQPQEPGAPQFIPEGSYLRLIQVTGGNDAQLALQSIDTIGAIDRLAIDVLDDTVHVSINGSEVFSRAELPYAAGGVGLTAYTSGEFDNFLLETQGTTTCTYDGNGNTTRCNDEVFTYDAENRLVRYEKGQTVAQYAYDALGRRIRKDQNGAVEQYVYDGEDVIADLDGQGAVKARYTNGLGIDEKLDLQPVGAQYGPYAYFADALGTTTDILDANGELQNRYDYTAFGEPTLVQENIENRYLFTGREWNPESEQYHYRARQYDPGSGRFSSRDPIGIQGHDINVYAYVGNNPVSSNDPLGLQENAEPEEKTKKKPMVDFTSIFGPEAKKIDPAIRRFYADPTKFEGVASVELFGELSPLFFPYVSAFTGQGNIPDEKAPWGRPGHEEYPVNMRVTEREGRPYWERFITGRTEFEKQVEFKGEKLLFGAFFEVRGKQVVETFLIRGTTIELIFDAKIEDGKTYKVPGAITMDLESVKVGSEKSRKASDLGFDIVFHTERDKKRPNTDIKTSGVITAPGRGANRGQPEMVGYVLFSLREKR